MDVFEFLESAPTITPPPVGLAEDFLDSAGSAEDFLGPPPSAPETAPQAMKIPPGFEPEAAPPMDMGTPGLGFESLETVDQKTSPFKQASYVPYLAVSAVRGLMTPVLPALKALGMDTGQALNTAIEYWKEKTPEGFKVPDFGLKEGPGLFESRPPVPVRDILGPTAEAAGFVAGPIRAASGAAGLVTQKLEQSARPFYLSILKGMTTGALLGEADPQKTLENMALFGVFEPLTFGVDRLGKLISDIKQTRQWVENGSKVRGLMLQSLDDAIRMNPNMTEADILRRWNNPTWRRQALERRDKPEVARADTIEVPPEPIAPAPPTVQKVTIPTPAGPIEAEISIRVTPPVVAAAPEISAPAVPEIAAAPTEPATIPGGFEPEPKSAMDYLDEEPWATPKAKAPWEMTLDDIENKYPVAKDTVDGRTVRKEIPNTDSIEASLDSFTELKGVREVDLSLFEAPPVINAKTKALAAAIKESGEINPLIVVIDKEGPYILEGANRYDAMKINGAKSIPAKVVIDEGSFYDATKKALSEGKPVPPEVLAEYPDLAPTTGEVIEPGASGKAPAPKMKPGKVETEAEPGKVTFEGEEIAEAETPRYADYPNVVFETRKSLSFKANKDEALSKISRVIKDAPESPDKFRFVTFKDSDSGAEWDVLFRKAEIRQFAENYKSGITPPWKGTTTLKAGKKKTPGPSKPKELISKLYRIKGDAKGWYTDGVVIMKGAPPPRAKFTDKETSAEKLQEYLNEKDLTDAEIRYYATVDPDIGEGVSKTPIADLGTGKDLTAYAIARAGKKRYPFDQRRIAYVTNRYPKVTWKMNKDRTMIYAYDKGKLVGIVSAINVTGQKDVPGIKMAARKRLASPAPDLSPSKPIAAEIRFDRIKDEKRHSQLLKRIEKALSLPIRVGKARFGKAAGLYWPSKQVVRIKQTNDIPVAIHEVGHHIQRLLGLMGRMPKEIRAMAYEGAKSVNKEGFAEFVRFYVTEPETAQNGAPEFFIRFEDALAAEPELQEIFVEVRQAWKDFKAAPSIAKLESFIVRGGKKNNTLTFNKLYTEIKDNLWPLKQAVDIAKDKGHVFKESEDPYILARLTRGWARRAEQYLKYKPFHFDKEKGAIFTGKSLVEVLNPVESAGEMHLLDNYLIAKRAVTDPGNRIASGFSDILTLDDFKQVVAELEPKFKKIGEDLQEYNDNLLKYFVDAGRISEDLAKRIKAKNPFYAPLYRLVDKNTSRVYGQKANGPPNPIKKMRGSSRDILSPTESLVYNTYAIINAADRNMIGNAMLRLSGLKGMGGVIEKIPFPVRPDKVNKDDLIKILNQLDITAEDFSSLPQEIITTFRPVYRAGDNEVIFYNKGKPELYEIGDKELYNSLSNIDAGEINALIKFMSYPAKWLRAGATTFSPEFGIRNPLRDQLTAFIQSEYGYIPGYDFVRGTYNMLGQTQTWQKFNISGAAHSTVVSIDRDYLAKNLKELFVQSKIKGLVKNPLKLIQAFSEITEEASRVGEFARGIKKGGEDIDTLFRSGMAGREVSIDFGRQGGSTARAANLISAFWNARLEGLDKMGRSFKKNPLRTGAKAFLAVTLPSILLWYMQKDDEYYQEIPSWRRVLFWNIIQHNEDGSLKRIISMPKPFEYGLLFGSVPEAALDWAYTKDPDTFKETIDAIGRSLNVFPMPTGAVPLIEWFSNKSMFFDRPIVPRGKEDLNPVQQSKPSTSETVKLVARMMDKIPGLKKVASPAKLENLLMGYTAGFGRLATEAGDWTISTFGVVDTPPDPEMKTTELPGIRALFARFPSMNTKSIEQFYDRYTTELRAFESAKDKLEIRGTLNKVRVEASDQLKYYKMAAASLSVQRKIADAIYKSTTLTPREKREYLDNIYISMINTARAGVGKKPLKGR